MKQELWRKAEDLFHAALERPPEAAGPFSMRLRAKTPSCGSKSRYSSRRMSSRQLLRISTWLYCPYIDCASSAVYPKRRPKIGTV
jgi:hypothetical protein